MMRLIITLLLTFFPHIIYSDVIKDSQLSIINEIQNRVNAGEVSNIKNVSFVRNVLANEGRLVADFRNQSIDKVAIDFKIQEKLLIVEVNLNKSNYFMFPILSKSLEGVISKNEKFLKVVFNFREK